MSEAIKQRLQAILELAKRGEHGEKEAAQKKLEQLLKKHGYSMSDLEEESKDLHKFKYDGRIRPYSRQLFSQICYAVIGDGGVYNYKGFPSLVAVECTKMQAVEIQWQYEILMNSLVDHFETSFSAFIQANHLYPENGEVLDVEDLPQEQRERAIQASQMAVLTPKTQIRKAIGGKA